MSIPLITTEDKENKLCTPKDKKGPRIKVVQQMLFYVYEVNQIFSRNTVQKVVQVVDLND